MLESGSIAPHFSLPDQDGRPRTLPELLRYGPLLVAFFPADFSSGCTRAACMIRDLHERMRELGLSVIGISPQGLDAHLELHTRLDLPFDFLSDPDRTVFGLYDLDGLLGFGVHRALYLIDSEGVIRDGVTTDLRLGQHEQFLHNALAVAVREQQRRRLSQESPDPDLPAVQ